MTTESPTATGELLHALTDDVSALLRQELSRAQDEMLAKARQAGQGAALLGAAGALGGLAAGTSAVLVVRVLDRWLPPRMSALAATSLYAAGGAALATRGWSEIRKAGPPLPQDTLVAVREQVESSVGAGTSPAGASSGVPASRSPGS